MRVTIRVSSIFGLVVLFACISCGDKATDSSHPVVLNCPEGITTLLKGDAWTHSFDVLPADTCCKIAWGITAGDNEPTGQYSIDQSGLFTFSSDSSDAGDIFTFDVSVTECGSGVGGCRFSVEVLNKESFFIGIEQPKDQYLGHVSSVSIKKVAGTEPISGFDFLIAFDPAVVTLQSIDPGSLLQSWGWQEFDHSFEAIGRFGGHDLYQFVRITASEGGEESTSPSILNPSENGELIRLQAYIEPDPSFECQTTPIKFAWFDCEDNALIPAGGEGKFISALIYDLDWLDDRKDISGVDCDSNWGVNYGGACPVCDDSVDLGLDRFVTFLNGGIDIACADSIDSPFHSGDLNGNGIPFEISDVVLYSWYFLYGSQIFDIDLAKQIAASEVNADSIYPSVGDMTYMIRVVTGDALPFYKLEPFAHTLDYVVQGSNVSVVSDVDIGAICLGFALDGPFSFEYVLEDMTIDSTRLDNEFRALIFHLGVHKIDAGSHSLGSVSGSYHLVRLQAADYYGNMMNVRIIKDGKVYTDFGDGVVQLAQ